MSTWGAETRETVAALLERLADGEAVELGPFADNGGGEDPAGEQAAFLRELAEGVRGERSYP